MNPSSFFLPALSFLEGWPVPLPLRREDLPSPPRFFRYQEAPAPRDPEPFSPESFFSPPLHFTKERPDSKL